MQIVTISKRTIIRKTIIILLCIGIGWYLKGKMTPQTSTQGMSRGDTYVLIQGVEKRDISPKKNYIGHVEAINSVDLRPQVTGYVEKVLFQEGSLVQQGDVLFVIEQKRYLANLELREAELASAQANLVKTERDYKRQKSLSSQNYASKATLDTSESNYLQAKAAVKQAEANLELAKIDMGYTEIKAPFTGYIGKALVTEGNYVNSSTQTLARIVQTDPIRVAFSVTDKDIIDFREKSKAIKEGKSSPISSELILPNGKRLVNHLKSRFTDNEIDTTTATIAVYNEYSNEQSFLIPGAYVQVLIGDTQSVEATLIPQAAVAQDEHGNYVMIVTPDSIAEQRRVELGEVFGDMQVVKSGLNDDDKVIIQGLQKVQNGQKVKAELLTSNTEGK